MSDPIGIVGCGIMGLQMIRRLVDEGHGVRAFDLDARARMAAAQLGADVVADAADAAAESEVCLLSLPTPAVVLQVVSTEPGGILVGDPRASVIVDMSTVDPTTSRRAADVAGAAGVGFLDAPVLGPPERCGSWTVPVGGDEHTLDVARPVLESLATRVVLVGPSGSGSTLKLLNNLMFAAINAVTAEALAGAERVGLDPATFVRTVADSGAGSVSNLFLQVAPKIVDGDFSPTFTLDLLRKDVDLAAQMLADAGFDAPMSQALSGLHDRAANAGLGHLDSGAMVKLYRGNGDQPAP